MNADPFGILNTIIGKDDQIRTIVVKEDETSFNAAQIPHENNREELTSKYNTIARFLITISQNLT